MTRLLLYTTLGCHLCELAAEMLRSLEEGGVVRVELVEISEDPTLVERYGIRIPVVRNPQTSAELGWPFESEDLLSLV